MLHRLLVVVGSLQDDQSRLVIFHHHPLDVRELTKPEATTNKARLTRSSSKNVTLSETVASTICRLCASLNGATCINIHRLNAQPASTSEAAQWRGTRRRRAYSENNITALGADNCGIWISEHDCCSKIRVRPIFPDLDSEC